MLFRWIGSAITLLLLTLLLAASPASARDARTVPVKANETGFGLYEESFTIPAPGGLRTAFGEPETIFSRLGEASCRFEWPSLGIYNVELAVFGTGGDACVEGVFLSAVLNDPSWHTPSGIHPGGPAKAAKKRAVAKCTKKIGCRGGGWILGMHPSVCAASKVASVIARVGKGRVRSLSVFTHGCE